MTFKVGCSEFLLRFVWDCGGFVGSVCFLGHRGLGFFCLLLLLFVLLGFFGGLGFLTKN